MDMIGHIVGTTLVSLLIPVLILISTRTKRPQRRMSTKAYSFGAVLAVLVCVLPAESSGQWGAAVISAVLALLILWWGYRRDMRALAKAVEPK